jgi:hypothetical protein
MSSIVAALSSVLISCLHLRGSTRAGNMLWTPSARPSTLPPITAVCLGLPLSSTCHSFPLPAYTSSILALNFFSSRQPSRHAHSSLIHQLLTLSFCCPFQVARWNDLPARVLFGLSVPLPTCHLITCENLFSIATLVPR